MKRAALPLLLALGGCVLTNATDREDWQQDFEILIDHMSSAYANLEWVRDERGLDVFALYQDAHTRLGEARSRRSARKILTAFVEAFDDPHFRVINGDDRDPDGDGSMDAGLPPGVSGADALDAMGFRGRRLDFRIDFEKLPDFERISPSDENPFAWGSFTVGEQVVGVLRIAHFGEDGYPEVARALWPRFAAAVEGPCDVACQWNFREHVMDALLTYLAEGAAAFRARDVNAVLIDITGNGGGTDWAAVAPRIFTPPLTRCPPVGVVRHPHHSERLARRRDYLQSLLDELDMSAASRSILANARDTMAAMVQKAEEPCDRRDLFRVADATLGCSQLVFGPACGVLEYLPPGSLADVTQRAVVFRPLDSAFEEGIWDGPLFVLTDHNTASASEQFVSLLEANDAATILGERTLGAGCGYIDGGIPAYLPHLDMTAWMPDCVRHRAGGRNEIEGIEPDVVIEWSGGDAKRARRIHEALRGLASGIVQE